MIGTFVRLKVFSFLFFDTVMKERQTEQNKKEDNITNDARWSFYFDRLLHSQRSGQ